MRPIKNMTLGQISEELRSLGWELEVEKAHRFSYFIALLPDLPRWIRHEHPFGVSYPQTGKTLEDWYRDALTVARRDAIPATLPDLSQES